MVDNFTDEANASDNGTFVVRLASRPHDNITVTLSVVDVIAADGSDPVDTEISFDNASVTLSTVLSFGPDNWSDNQTVTFWAIDDQVDEHTQGPDNHTTTLGWSNLPAFTSDNDSHYVYHYANNRSFPTDNLTAAVGDNDSAEIVFSWEGGDNVTSEDGKSIKLLVSLNSRPFIGDSNFMKLRVRIDNRTEAYFEIPDDADELLEKDLGAVYKNDYLGYYSTIQFYGISWTAGVSRKVIGLDDWEKEDNKTGTISAEIQYSADAIYNNLSDQNITFINLDNEGDLELQLSQSALQIDEGSSAEFTAWLNQRPTENVTISAQGNDPTELTSSNSVLMTSPGKDNYSVSIDASETLITSVTAIKTGTWSIPQTVTVSAVDDNITDGNQPVTVQLTGAGVVGDNVTVTVVDNDTSGIVFNWVGDNFTSEDGDNATFTVRLRSAPFSSADNTTDGLVDATVHLGVRGKDNHSVSFSADSLTFGPDNWSAAQTVTVSAVDDNYDEGPASAVDAGGRDNQTYTIYIDNVTSADSVYAAMTKFDNISDMSTVIVEDNDLSGIGVELVASDNSNYQLKFFLLSDPSGDNVTLSLEGFGGNIRFDNDSASGGESSTLNLTLSWVDNATVYLTNTSRNLDNESDDDDGFLDNLTILSFSASSTSDNSSYHGKQLSKTLIRRVDTGVVYTDFDNGTSLPK